MIMTVFLPSPQLDVRVLYKSNDTHKEGPAWTQHSPQVTVLCRSQCFRRLTWNFVGKVNMELQLDATITVLLISKISSKISVLFGTT
jgi:hypothetical protein